MFPLLMKYFLRFFGLWPGHNTNFFLNFFVFLSSLSLIFQCWHLPTVFDNMELLLFNIRNILVVFILLVKIIIFGLRRRYVKDVFIEMMDDWCQINNPEKLQIMKNHVQFSNKFFINTLIVYNISILMIISTPLQTYFNKCVENRFLPLLSKFPFSVNNSPVYEIIYLNQAIILLQTGIMYSVSDSTYAAMVLHASTKIENLRVELDSFLNKVLKSGERSAAEILIKKHREAIQFATKVEYIFSGQLFLHFLLTTLQLCFQGFIYLTALSDNNNKNINEILKDTSVSMSILAQLIIYCALGEYLQSKSVFIAESAYLIPWYELQCNEAKVIMMFIQRAQKPLTITAGKIISVTHFTFINIIKTAVSYLSVLRAARV